MVQEWSYDIKTLVERTRVAITMSRRLAQDGPSWQKRHIRSKTSCGSDNNTQTGTMEPLVEIFQVSPHSRNVVADPSEFYRAIRSK